MAKSSKTQVPTHVSEPRHHRWLVFGVSVLAVIVSLPHIYWSYQCRYHGKLCESAIASPSEQTISANKEVVKEELTSSRSGREIEGIELLPSQNMFRSDRTDVAVKFKSSESIIVDSIDMSELDNSVTYKSSDGSVALIAGGTWQYIDGGKRKVMGTLLLYVLASSLEKRKIVFQCMEASWRDPRIELANLTFDQNRKTIILDLLTGCSDLIVQGMHKLRLADNAPGVDGLYMTRGDHIEIILDENYQISKLESAGSKLLESRQAKNSEADTKRILAAFAEIESCAESGVSKAGKPPLPYLCYATTVVSDSKYAMFRLYVAKEGKPQELFDSRCNGNFSTPADKNRGSDILYMLCAEDVESEKRPEGQSYKYRDRTTTILVYHISLKQPLKLIITCSCARFDLSDFSFDIATKALAFELRTDAARVRLEDRYEDLRVSNDPNGRDIAIAKLGVTFSGNGNYIKHELLERVQ